MLKTLALLAALAAALAVFAAAPSVAEAGTPCWKKVISGYTDADGKIDGHYSRRCLRLAMKNVDEDLRDYTGILDAISALLYGNGKPSGGNGTSSGTTGSAMNPAATAA